jgi:hypothetical protein
MSGKFINFHSFASNPDLVTNYSGKALVEKLTATNTVRNFPALHGT